MSLLNMAGGPAAQDGREIESATLTGRFASVYSDKTPANPDGQTYPLVWHWEYDASTGFWKDAGTDDGDTAEIPGANSELTGEVIPPVMTFSEVVRYTDGSTARDTFTRTVIAAGDTWDYRAPAPSGVRYTGAPSEAASPTFPGIANGAVLYKSPIGVVGASGATGTVLAGGSTPAFTDSPSLTGLTVTDPIEGSVTGNAGTVTDGVVTTGTYVNPPWLTGLSAAKITSGLLPDARLSPNVPRYDDATPTFDNPVYVSDLYVSGAVHAVTNQTFVGGTAAKFFGDSYTAAALRNAPPSGDVAQNWPTILAAELGLTVTNTAVGGSQLVESDQMNAILGTRVEVDSQSFMLTDFNGRDNFGTDATVLGYWEDALTVAMLNLSIPGGANKIYNNDDSHLTYSGSGWADPLTYGGAGHERASSTVGDYVEYTGYFSDLYIGLSRDTLDWGDYEITLDGEVYAQGTAQATYTSGGGTAGHPSHHYPFAVPVHAASGTHTVRVTVVASSGAGKVYLNKLWIPTDAATSTGPNLYVGTPCRVASYPTSAPYNLGSDAANGLMTDIIKRVAASLNAFGLRISVVPTDQVFSPTAHVGPDGIHPNQAGHTAIAGAFYKAMTGNTQPQVKSTGPLGVDTSGNYALSKGLTISGPSNAFGLNVITPTLSKGISVISTKALGSGSGGGLWAGTSFTPTAGSQRIGGLVGYSNDGTNLYTPATLYMYSDSEGWSGSGQGSMFVFNATTPGSVGLHEVLRIRGGGNFGIGNTTAPQRVSISDGSVRIDSLAAPLAPTVALSGGAGSIDAGTRFWKITWTNPAGETTTGTGSSGLVVDGTQGATITRPSLNLSSNPTVSGWKVYRRNESDSKWYLAGTVADVSTTTFTDTASDASLTTLEPATNTAGGSIKSSTGTVFQMSGLSAGIGTDGTDSLTTQRLLVKGTSTALGVTAASSAASGTSGGGGIAAATYSLPTAQDHRLALFSGNVWSGSAWLTGASIGMYSKQTWIPGSAQGTYWRFDTTANGGTSRAEAARLDDVGLNVGGGASSITTAAKIHAYQPTAGNPVFQAETAATGDDPNFIITQFPTSTTNATQATVQTITLTASKTYLIEARVVARRTGGTAGSAEDGGVFVVRGAFKTVGGAATLIGSVTTAFSAADDAYAVTMDTSGADVRVRVSGIASTNIRWHATSFIQYVGS